MKGRPLLVTAALILRNGKVLVAKRLPDSRFEPGKWEFPGGKVDFGEHPRESIKRELLEEMGIEVHVGGLYDIASHVYDQKGMLRHVVILFYRCDIMSGEPQPLDCQELRWLDKEQLMGFSFVEGDNPLVAKLSGDETFWLRT
jgi:8-oxo-dGTP diphosphatase